MRLKDLINKAHFPFYSVAPGESVADALKLMSGYNVSALLVSENKMPVGIFTEWDLVRCYTLFPEGPVSEVRIKEVMTHKLITVDATIKVHEAVDKMLKSAIRHLPILSGERAVALMSLEDLATPLFNALDREIQTLKDYIIDLQDADHD